MCSFLGHVLIVCTDDAFKNNMGAYGGFIFSWTKWLDITSHPIVVEAFALFFGIRHLLCFLEDEESLSKANKILFCTNSTTLVKDLYASSCFAIWREIVHACKYLNNFANDSFVKVTR